VKLSTVAFILAVGLWLPGYLHYGWLLIQTIASATSLWITVVFSVQFILWLVPLTGLVAFLIIEKMRM
jgi:hypothetical protein